MNDLAKSIYQMCAALLNGAEYIEITEEIYIERTWSAIGYGYRLYLGQYGTYDVTERVAYDGTRRYEFEGNTEVPDALTAQEAASEVAEIARVEFEAAY